MNCDHCLRDEDELADLELSLETVCEECADDGRDVALEALRAELATAKAELERLRADPDTTTARVVAYHNAIAMIESEAGEEQAEFAELICGRLRGIAASLRPKVNPYPEPR